MFWVNSNVGYRVTHMRLFHPFKAKRRFPSSNDRVSKSALSHKRNGIRLNPLIIFSNLECTS